MTRTESSGRMTYATQSGLWLPRGNIRVSWRTVLPEPCESSRPPREGSRTSRLAALSVRFADVGVPPTEQDTHLQRDRRVTWPMVDQDTHLQRDLRSDVPRGWNMSVLVFAAASASESEDPTMSAPTLPQPLPRSGRGALLTEEATALRNI